MFMIVVGRKRKVRPLARNFVGLLVSISTSKVVPSCSRPTLATKEKDIWVSIPFKKMFQQLVPTCNATHTSAYLLRTLDEGVIAMRSFTKTTNTLLLVSGLSL